jgi:hypothetical protein
VVLPSVENQEAAMNYEKIEKAVDDALRRLEVQRQGDTSSLEAMLASFALSVKINRLEELLERASAPSAKPQVDAIVAKVRHAIEPEARVNSLNGAKESLDVFLTDHVEASARHGIYWPDGRPDDWQDWERIIRKAVPGDVGIWTFTLNRTETSDRRARWTIHGHWEDTHVGIIPPGGAESEPATEDHPPDTRDIVEALVTARKPVIASYTARDRCPKCGGRVQVEADGAGAPMLFCKCKDASPMFPVV